VAKKYNVKGIFAGHDHLNDFQGFYKEVMLGYGRKSG
jgi:ribosomal protein L20A (L18A)